MSATSATNNPMGVSSPEPLEQPTVIGGLVPAVQVNAQLDAKILELESITGLAFWRNKTSVTVPDVQSLIDTFRGIIRGDVAITTAAAASSDEVVASTGRRYLAQLPGANSIDPFSSDPASLSSRVLNAFPRSAIRIEGPSGNIVDTSNGDKIGNIFVSGWEGLAQRYQSAGGTPAASTKHAPGTPVEGSTDPRTKEQNETIMRAIAGSDSSTLPPSFAGAFILPNGSVTRDATALTIPPARVSEITDALSSGAYAFMLNAQGVPVQFYPVGTSASAYAASVGDFNAGKVSPQSQATAQQTVATAQAAAIAESAKATTTAVATATPGGIGNVPLATVTTTGGNNMAVSFSKRPTSGILDSSLIDAGAVSRTTAKPAVENAVSAPRILPLTTAMAGGNTNRNAMIALLGAGALLWWLSRNG